MTPMMMGGPGGPRMGGFGGPGGPGGAGSRRPVKENPNSVQITKENASFFAVKIPRSPLSTKDIYQLVRGVRTAFRTV